MDRRDLLRGVLMAGAAWAVRPAWAWRSSEPAPTAATLAALERGYGGRLGVAMLDTHDGRRLAHRGGERFLMCSTFKLLLAAQVLARVDAGKERLDRRIVFDKAILQDWSPVTGLNVGPPGMTVGGLCEAALIMSDNSAANLLLDACGGPTALTSWLRTLGDAKTRLDHGEPLVNQPHGEQDTTTPWSMLEDMRKLLLGDVLSVSSRQRLSDWLVHNQTGAQALRAGLPPGWRVGDKTGSNVHANNDVAIIWPVHRKPVLVTAYCVDGTRAVTPRKKLLAEVGRVVAAWTKAA